MGSLEENFPYALMGKINLMLYPYITLLLRLSCTIGAGEISLRPFQSRALASPAPAGGESAYSRPALTTPVGASAQFREVAFIKGSLRLLLEGAPLISADCG